MVCNRAKSLLHFLSVTKVLCVPTYNDEGTHTCYVVINDLCSIDMF